MIVSIHVESMNAYHKNSKEGKVFAVTSYEVPVKSLSGAVTHPVSFFCEIVVVSCTTFDICKKECNTIQATTVWPYIPQNFELCC